MFRRFRNRDHGISEAEDLGEVNLVVKEVYLDQRGAPFMATTKENFVFAYFCYISCQLVQLKFFGSISFIRFSMNNLNRL